MAKSTARFLLMILFATGVSAFAQRPPAAVKVTYSKSSNGKPIAGQDSIVVFSSLLRTDLLTRSILDRKAKYPFEQSYLDRQTGHYVQIATLSPGKSTVTIDSTEVGKQIFELTNETQTILGYTCRRAKTVINSNKIDLWYTNDIKIKGAPTVLGQNLGLVLKMERNGNFAITATRIQPLKKMPNDLPSLSRRQKPVDVLSYRDQLWKSRFITIPIFRNEVINFTDKPKSNDSIERFASGTVIAKKVKFPVIKSGSRVFVDAVQRSEGDAYDRTASVFMIPRSGKTDFLDALHTSHKKLPAYENGNGKSYHGVVRKNDYVPPMELMRFFTPFGVHHYNTIRLKNRTWQDSATYRQEITEIAPFFSGKEVWIGANIANYDKGGHRLSVNITVHPEDNPLPNDVVLPLFLTNNIMEAAGQEYATMFDHEDGLRVEFTLSAPVKSAFLRYITTGHGGWENGDEFLPRENALYLNGTRVFSFIPWRMDCGSYRSYNPASGNFSNGLSSSDYSRSNWCPGTVTNPIFIPLGDLPAGTHNIQVKIPQGAPEGNSFSSWVVSGVIIGQSAK